MRIAGKKPLSFVLKSFVYVSATLTVGALGFLIAYILIKGVPHLSMDLFAWEYTSDNCSMMPAIINTLEMTFFALLAVPDSYREGSFGLGAGKLRTVFQIVLPSAIPQHESAISAHSSPPS